MIKAITITIIIVSLIIALFFGWYFYQQARNKERIMLIKRGDSLDDILSAQKKNKFKFVFPWIKLAVVTLSFSLAFLTIGLVFKMQGDDFAFTGFLRAFILGVFFSAAMFINHFISKKDKTGG